MQVSRAGILPTSYPVSLATVRALDMTSGDLPFYQRSVLPDIDLDTRNITLARKGGFDFCDNRIMWTVDSGIGVSQTPGVFGGRDTLDFTSNAVDLRVYAPHTPSYTLLICASIDAGEYSAGVLQSDWLSLCEVLDSGNDDGISVFYRAFGEGILAGGGTQFTPDSGPVTGSNMSGSFLPGPDEPTVFAVTFDNATKVSKQYVNSRTARATMTHSAGKAALPDAAWYFGSTPLAALGSSPGGLIGKIGRAIRYPAVFTDEEGGDLDLAIDAMIARYGVVP